MDSDVEKNLEISLKEGRAEKQFVLGTVSDAKIF